MKQIILLPIISLFIFILLSNTSSSVSRGVKVDNIQDRTNDSLVLIDFIIQNSNLNWDLTTPISSWKGVTLNENNRVIKLDLFLNSSLPATIGQLSDLEELKLKMETTSLNLPDALADLNKLRIFHLIMDSSSEVFNTAIIGQLINLEELEIFLGTGGSGINNIAFEQLSQLTYLRIEFSESRRMPVGIFQLKELETLLYINNNTEGEIPAELANLNKLKILDLSANDFPEVLPSVITQLPNLVSYTFRKGNPHFKTPNTISSDIGLLNKLEVLHLENCQLTGSLPLSVNQLEALKVLSLNENKFSGPIPSTLYLLQNLEHLNLQGNELSGNLTNEIGQLTKLKVLNVGRNDISGKLPEAIGQLNALEELVLELNNFDGALPESLSQLTDLTSLRISGNNFSGSFPLIPSDNIQSLFLSRNQFHTFPTYELSANSRLNISNNKFSFDDVLPTLESVPVNNFTYAPQDIIFEDTTISVIERNSIVFDLGIDAKIPSNSYVWFKNRKSFSTLSENKLSFENIKAVDAGRYSVEISNPLAPGLILRGGDLNIEVIPCTEFNNLTFLNAAIEIGMQFNFVDQQLTECGIYRDTLLNQYGCDSIVQLNLKVLDNGIEVCRQKDSLTLVEFYEHHGGENWFNSWNFPKHPLDSLKGVTLNEIGRVTGLLLDSNNLVNPLFPGINQLEVLEQLSLSKNQITTSLPRTLAALPQLNYLNLSFNSLTDLDFNLISQISNLEHLDLSHNEFINSLNSFQGPTSEKLRYLDLSNNLFTGFLSGSNLNLRQLRYLDLSGNEGIISTPRNINNEFRQLEYLDLSNNPLEFVQVDTTFTSLRVLKLASCNLDDNLVQLFGPLSPPSLQQIDITDNLFKELPFNDSNELERVQLALNFFTLRHILPFSDIYADTTDYAPQKRLPSRSNLTWAPCDAHVLQQERDGEGTIFEWYYQTPLRDILLKTDTVPFLDLDQEDFFLQPYLDYAGRYLVVRNNIRYESNFFIDTIDVAITSQCLVEEQININACIGDEVIIMNDTFTVARPIGNVCIDLENEIPDFLCDSIFRIAVSFQTCNLEHAPKVFTPNLGGLNQTFIFPQLRAQPNLIPGSRLTILNRQKQLVFEQKNYANDWNGTDLNGNPLPSGTYYFRLEYGNEKYLNGTITLIR